MSKARVSLVHGGDRRANVFNALELVRADVESRLADQVMLKPNFLSSDNQLASSHVDALRGVLDFLLTAPLSQGDRIESGQNPVRLFELNQADGKSAGIRINRGAQPNALIVSADFRVQI